MISCVIKTASSQRMHCHDWRACFAEDQHGTISLLKAEQACRFFQQGRKWHASLHYNEGHLHDVADAELCHGPAFQHVQRR